MKPTKPDSKLFMLPGGTREVIYAKDQPEYLPLPVLKTPDGKLASMWIPNPHELDLLNKGIPVCIIHYTFNQPLQPLFVGVGGMDLTEDDAAAPDRIKT